MRRRDALARALTGHLLRLEQRFRRMQYGPSRTMVKQLCRDAMTPFQLKRRTNGDTLG
jgi:hypothetical protein